MRRLFSRSKGFSTLWVSLALCILLAATAFGCAQSPNGSGGGQASDSQTTAARAGTTVQPGTTASAESTTQKETTRRETTRQPPQTEQQAREQQERAREQEQQAQQAQQAQQQAGQEQESQEQEDQQQQGQQQTVTVRITGTEGLSFSGRVGSTQDLRRIKGSVPEEYEIPSQGTAVTATIRKQQPGQGTLGVEVVRGGEVVADRKTSTAPGILNLVWTPQRQGN